MDFFSFPNCFENCGNALFGGQCMVTRSEASAAAGSRPTPAFSSPVPSRKDPSVGSEEAISPDQKIKSMAAALFDSVCADDVGICESILQANPELVNYPDATDPQGRTAIHYAACSGSVFTAALLIRYGADMHRVTLNNKTPMVLAAEQKRASILQYFLRVNLADRAGRQSDRRRRTAGGESTSNTPSVGDPTLLTPTFAAGAGSANEAQITPSAGLGAGSGEHNFVTPSAGAENGAVETPDTLPLDTHRDPLPAYLKPPSAVPRKPLTPLKQNQIAM